MGVAEAVVVFSMYFLFTDFSHLWVPRCPEERDKDIL